MNKIYYFVLVYYLIVLNQLQCNLVFNVTENQRTQISGLTVFKILDIPHRNNSILSQCTLISLNDAGTSSNNRGIIRSHDYIPLRMSSDLLEIDKSNGDIVLKMAIDRESVCNYQNRNTNCELSFILTYQIKMKEFSLRIIDVNDNAPVFREKIVTIKLTEGKATNINKGQLKLPRASDADSINNGLEKYTVKFDTHFDLAAKRNFEEYFKLENKKDDSREVIPYLKIIKILDRESVDRFDFTLVAWDYGKKRGDCRITLTVQDINDNAPVWVWKNSNLDMSQSPPSIIDVSECSNTPAKELLRLHATDADDPTTINGQIEYSVASVDTRASEYIDRNMDLQGLFYISGGQMLHVDMTRLGGLGSRTLTVKLRASDGGDLYTEASVDIRILDCNDNRPIIDVKHRTPRIVENEMKETKLTTIVVKDIDLGQNANFDCSINDTYRFQLNIRANKILYPHRGLGRLVIYDLSTVGGIKFDREQSSTIVLMINCEDKGSPTSLSSSQMITVRLEDVNDQVPTFQRDSFTFRVEENVAIGSKLATVRAIDRDSGDNGRISYTLTDSNQSAISSSNSNSFSINSRGEIQNSIEIDREKVSRYTLIVTATDYGKPKRLSSSCTVSIIVEDRNDWAPEVRNEYRFDILEAYGSKTIQQVVGKIKATDKDMGKNGELRFSILHRYGKNLNGKYIQISNDGQISIYGKVDREKTPTIKTEVVIRDLGKPPLSSRTTIVINVLDVNDNKPTFVFPNLKTSKNYVNISFDAPAGTTIATINATDPDNELNGTVKYSLPDQPIQNELFELHVTGQLVLTSSPSTYIANNKENNSKRSSKKIRHLPDRLMIQAEDSALKNPHKEFTTLFLRYYHEVDPNSKTNNKNNGNNRNNNDYNKRQNDNKVRKDALYKYKNRNNNGYNNINNRERNRRHPNNKSGNSSSNTSTNMALLYGLAVVLFVVFIAVLFLLVFVFFKSRHSNHSLNNRNIGHNNNQSSVIGDYKAVIDTSQRNFHSKKTMNTHQSSLAGSNARCTTGLLKPNPAVHTMGIRKSVDDLLAANFYDLSNNQTIINPKDNYNQLLWMPSEPHYNLLYPTQQSPPTTTMHQHSDRQNTHKQLSEPLNNTIPVQSVPHMTLNNLKQDHLDQHSNNNSSSDKIDSLHHHLSSSNIITSNNNNNTINNNSNSNNINSSGNTSTSKPNAYVTSTFV